MSEEDRLPTPDEEVGPYRSSGRPDSMHLGLHELSMTSIDARDSLEMLSVRAGSAFYVVESESAESREMGAITLSEVAFAKAHLERVTTTRFGHYFTRWVVDVVLSSGKEIRVRVPLRRSL